jgi:peptide deformylase
MSDIIVYREGGILDKPCELVTDFKEASKIVKQLFETMKSTGQAVGLAANQVGISKRILVMLDGKNEVAMINPEIVSTEGPEISSYEGCLSFPGQIGPVTRPEEATVKWFDVEGQQHQGVFEGFSAKVVQHEIDHLNGIVFTSKMNRGNRRKILSKVRKKAK